MSRLRGTLGSVLAAVSATVFASSANAQELTFPEEDVEITVTWWGGNYRNDLHNRIIDLFEQRHPNVTVNRVPGEYASFWERLAVQAASGNAPEQFQMQNRFIAQFGSGRVMQPLDDYIEAGLIDVADTPDFLLDAGRIDGQVMMIPTSFSFRGLMYNGAALEAAGIAPPTVETTWDEFAQILRDLQAAGLPEGMMAAGLNDCEDDSTFYAFVRGYGSQPYAPDGSGLGFDRDLAVSYFAFWDALQDDGILLDPATAAERAGDNAQESPLAQGLVAFQSHPSNQLTSLRTIIESADMTSLPRGPRGAGDAFIVSGQSMSINATDAEKIVAAAYIDFFHNDPEAAAIYQGDNGIPGSQSGRDALEGDLPHVQLFEQIKDEIPPFGALPVGYPQVREALIRICAQVAFGQLSAEEGADAFISAAESSLR